MCYCIACLYCVHVLQRNWIKDMDTGAVYVLNGDTDAGGGGGSGGAAGAGRVTELLSGKELRWVLLFAAAAARDMDAGRQAWARSGEAGCSKQNMTLCAGPRLCCGVLSQPAAAVHACLAAA